MSKFYFVPPHVVEKVEALKARLEALNAGMVVDSADALLQPDQTEEQRPSVLRRIFQRQDS